MSTTGILSAGDGPNAFDSEMPGIAQLPLLCAVGDDVAVTIGPIEGYSSGLRITLYFWCRRPFGNDLLAALTRHGGGTQEGVGFRYATGYEVRSPVIATSAFADEIGTPMPVELVGGQGTAMRAEIHYLLRTIPQEGDLTCVVEVPSHGLSRVELTIDGDKLREAVASARRVWS